MSIIVWKYIIFTFQNIDDLSISHRSMVTATMPPWMIAMQLAAAVQLQTQLHCITQLSESRIPNKFTTEFFSTRPWPCPCLILRCCHCLFWTFQIIPVRFDHDVYNLFIPFTKSSSQSNMTYRKIYTIYHRQQSTRTGLNTHLTALHTKYCLLSWLFIRTIESERLFSAPQCISRCTISGTNGTFPQIRLVQYH